MKKVKPTTWFVKKLIEMGACSDAIRYATKYRTFPAAWQNCYDISWMLWLIEQLELADLVGDCPRYCCDPDDVVKKRILRRFPAERVAKALRKKG